MIGIFAPIGQKIKKCEEELEELKDYISIVCVKIDPYTLARLITKRANLETRLIKLRGKLK
jgi:hypothetical protein